MTAYVIGEIDVDDPDGYRPYFEKAPATVLHHGGRYLVKAGRTEALEGDPPRSRVVVLAFDDMQAALDWYHSDEYQAVAPARQASATTRVFIVEGAD